MKMVQLHVKRGDESQFLFNATVDAPLETVIQEITGIYNGRLKVDRICSGETYRLCCPFSLCGDEMFLYQHLLNCRVRIVLVCS